MVTIECDWCKKPVDKYPSQIKRFKHQFCGRICKYKWNKTVSGYWKGKKIPKYARKRMSENHADVSGKNNPRWKGGRRTDKDGYVLIWNPKHPHSDYHGYVREHRLVMEKEIGRYLKSEEVVHHRDNDKQNNKIENLKLYTNGAEHQKGHYPEAKHIKHSPAWKLENSTSP